MIYYYKKPGGSPIGASIDRLHNEPKPPDSCHRVAVVIQNNIHLLYFFQRKADDPLLPWIAKGAKPLMIFRYVSGLLQISRVRFYRVAMPPVVDTTSCICHPLAIDQCSALYHIISLSGIAGQGEGGAPPGSEGSIPIIARMARRRTQRQPHGLPHRRRHVGFGRRGG